MTESKCRLLISDRVAARRLVQRGAGRAGACDRASRRRRPPARGGGGAGTRPRGRLPWCRAECARARRAECPGDRQYDRGLDPALPGALTFATAGTTGYLLRYGLDRGLFAAEALDVEL